MMNDALRGFETVRVKVYASSEAAAREPHLPVGEFVVAAQKATAETASAALAQGEGAVAVCRNGLGTFVCAYLARDGRVYPRNNY